MAIMYVTVAGANNKDGTDWNNAFGYAEWETDFENAAVAGDIYYVEAGTYTLTSDMSTGRDGLTTSTIQIIGVKAGTTLEPPALSDWAYGSDRPLIACAGYLFVVDDYWHIRNIEFTLAGATKYVKGDGGIIFDNCKATNSGTGTAICFYPSLSTARAIHCEAISTSRGFYILGATSFTGCYVHDCRLYGFEVRTSYTMILDCVIDTCVDGINLAANAGTEIKNSTIRNCTRGINATTASRNTIVGNIFDGNAIGANWTTEQKTNFFNNNCWNNTVDTSNATKGNNAVTADPLLTSTLIAESDGTTDGADQTKFEDTTNNPFSGVATTDYLIIHSGTSVTTGVYAITAVISNSELTISSGATTGGSSIVYGIIKGEDFTLTTGSPCLSTGYQPGTNTGLTGDYKINIGVDQDDVTAAGGGTAVGVIGG